MNLLLITTTIGAGSRESSASCQFMNSIMTMMTEQVMARALYPRLEPGWFSQPPTGRFYPGIQIGQRLAYPVNYSTGLAAMVGMLLGTIRFLYPNVLSEPHSKFKVGTPDQYEEGKVVERYKEQNAWIVRNRDERGRDIIYALSTTCTHLGCTPNWLESDKKFKCPCHGSGFRISGVNFEGPAPRPLERWAVRVADDGQILVDKSKKFQKELGQWDDPESFIPMG